MPGSRGIRHPGAGRSPPLPALDQARGPSGPAGPGLSLVSGPSAPPPGLAASAPPPGAWRRPGERRTRHLGIRRAAPAPSTPAPKRQPEQPEEKCHGDTWCPGAPQHRAATGPGRRRPPAHHPLPHQGMRHGQGGGRQGHADHSSAVRAHTLEDMFPMTGRLVRPRPPRGRRGRGRGAHLRPGRGQPLHQPLGLVVVVALEALTAPLPVQAQLHLVPLQALLPLHRQRQLPLVPTGSEPRSEHRPGPQGHDKQVSHLSAAGRNLRGQRRDLVDPWA